MEQIFVDFQNSVVELADKLPQWSSEDLKRRKYSAMFSLCEEAGEISGLMSKYRCRKKKDIDYYNTAFNDLPEESKEEIKINFIDEVGDFLWVLICSEHSILDRETVLNTVLEYYTEYDATQKHQLNNIENALMRLIAETSSLCKAFECNINAISCVNIDCVAIFFAMFCTELYFEYGITLEEIIKHNMEKLGVRYDKDGKRTDGK